MLASIPARIKRKPLPLISAFLLKASFLSGLFLFLIAEANAANRYWIASVSSNWNDATKWAATSGGTGGAGVPVAGDAVFFDNLGTGNCTINAAVNITSLDIGSGYTGTITQGANTIAISSTASFSGGVFTGGSANMTVTGAFTLSGAAFTSTSAILELRNNAAFTSGTFTHNNGTVKFNTSGSPGTTISGISPVFYGLEFVGLGLTYTISSSGNITVLNNLAITGSIFYNLSSGTIDVKGNINVSNTATGCGGDAMININGTGAQTFTGNTTAGQGALPQVTINKSTGTLNLVNYPSVSNNFTYTTGTVSAGTSTFCFTHGNVPNYAVTGNLTLNNIEFIPNSSGIVINIDAATTLTANGNLLMAGTGNTIINTGNINVKGDISLTNTAGGGGGTATININGTGSQSLDGTAVTMNQSRLPLININKTFGILSLSGNISFSSDINYTAGIINAGTSTCYIVNNLTITGSFSVYKLNISAAATVTLTIASGSTLTVANDLTLDNGSSNISINTGTIAAQGNIIINNTATGGGGTGTILINGIGAQAITSTGVIGQGRLPAVTINKLTGTLTFPFLITVRGNWTYTAGLLDVTTNNSTIVFSNNLTITGTHILNNITFDGSNNYTFTIASGTTVTANKDMNIIGGFNVAINTGNINLNGNLNLSNTATGGGGTAVISFTGTGSQAITGSLLSYQSSLPGITINKLTGTLTFPSLITVRGNWTYTLGSYDVSTNNSTILFSGNLSITGTHTLNHVEFGGSNNFTFTITTGTTLAVAGNMTISGTFNVTLNTGTINLNGNLMLTNTATGGGGNAVIAFVASVNQNITSSLAINQCNLPGVTINKPGGTLLFPSIITVRGNWTYTAGTLDLGTNNSTVAFANSLGFTGTHTLNHVIFEGNNNNTFTINTGTVLTVTGTLSTTGSSNVFLNTGSVAGTTAIQAKGDIAIGNTSLTGGGNAGISISGTGAQAFTSTAASGQGKLPYIKIQKSSGTLTMSGIISESRDWAYSSGTVSPGTSTVVFGGNSLAISSTGMNFYDVAMVASNITLSNSLSANHNLTISGTAVLLAGSNTINLGGNWSNYGTAGFTEGTSTVNFNGSALQTITGTGGENFASLTANNSASGIQLVNDVTIATTLTMTQGNIDLNGNNLTLGTSAASKGTLARTAGTISGSGSFKRWFNTAIIADGAAAGLFPVGNTTDYRPFYVSAPATAPSTGGTVTIAYNNAGSNTNVAITDGIYVVAVRKNLSWTIATGNGLAGGSYNLRAEGTGFGLVGNTGDLRLTLANSVVGTAGANAGTVINPQINRTGLSFTDLSNSFYVGSVNASSSTLPITLVSFTAYPVNGQVKLDWETSAELNNDYFTIQRSTNTVNWEDIKTVNGSGNSSSNSTYSVYDENPQQGISYYRLLQTDLNGKQTVSAIRSVTLGNAVAISIYPNPATSYVLINSENPGKLKISLFNSNGQTMKVPMQVNGNNAVLNIAGLSTGIYFIRLLQDGGKETIRTVVKQ